MACTFSSETQTLFAGDETSPVISNTDQGIDTDPLAVLPNPVVPVFDLVAPTTILDLATIIADSVMTDPVTCDTTDDVELLDGSAKRIGSQPFPSPLVTNFVALPRPSQRVWWNQKDEIFTIPAREGKRKLRLRRFSYSLWT